MTGLSSPPSSSASLNWIDAVHTIGLNSSGSVDNAATLQAYINKLVTQATTANDTIGGYTIHFAAGKYKFLSGITTRPWIKFVSDGNVEFDFTGLTSAAQFAIRCYNQDAPSGATGYDAGNFGAWLDGDNGTFAIMGPGQTVGTIRGLDIGNTSSTGGNVYANFRNTRISNVLISGFYNGLFLECYDLYFLSIYKCSITLAQNCIATTTSNSQNNSGENISFQDCKLYTANCAVLLDAPALDITFIGCSFDYLQTQVCQLTSNGSYMKLAFIDCHLENYASIISRAGGSVNNCNVLLDGCKLVPTTYYISPVPTGARADGQASPYAPLFTGAFFLTFINSVTAGETVPYYLANAGTFACDSSVVVLKWNWSEFNYVWLGSRSLTRLRNSNFAQAALAQDLRKQQVPGWLYADSGYGNVASVIDNTHVFSPSTLSLKLTAGGANAYHVMISDAIALPEGATVLAQPIIYGASSTGNLNSSITYRCYQSQQRMPVAISSITASGTVATVTTAVAHGLVSSDVTSIQGCTQTEFNIRGPILSVPSSTTFTYYVESPTVSTVTGTPVYQPESLIFLGSVDNYGSALGTLYNDSTQPGWQTGNARTYWIREPFVQSVSLETAPAGTTHVKIQHTLANFASGDIVWLGEIACNTFL